MVFWCSKCRCDHAGVCPSPLAEPKPADAAEVGSVELARAYGELDLENLKRHFLAAKEALLTKIGP